MVKGTDIVLAAAGVLAAYFAYEQYAASQSDTSSGSMSAAPTQLPGSSSSTPGLDDILSGLPSGTTLASSLAPYNSDVSTATPQVVSQQPAQAITLPDTITPALNTHNEAISPIAAVIGSGQVGNSMAVTNALFNLTPPTANASNSYSIISGSPLTATVQAQQTAAAAAVANIKSGTATLTYNAPTPVVKSTAKAITTTASSTSTGTSAQSAYDAEVAASGHSYLLG